MWIFELLLHSHFVLKSLGLRFSMVDLRLLWPIYHVTHSPEQRSQSSICGPTITNSRLSIDHKHLQHNLIHDKKLDPPRQGLKLSDEARSIDPSVKHITEIRTVQCHRAPVYWRWAKTSFQWEFGPPSDWTVRPRQFEREEYKNDDNRKNKPININRTWRTKQENTTKMYNKTLGGKIQTLTPKPQSLFCYLKIGLLSFLFFLI